MTSTIYCIPWQQDVPNDDIAAAGAQWLNKQSGHGLVLVDRVQDYRSTALSGWVATGTAVYSPRSSLIRWRGDGAVLAAWPTADLLKKFDGEISRARAVLVLQWGDGEQAIKDWLLERKAIDLLSSVE